MVGQQYQWAKGLRHHCGVCERPYSHPNAISSCFGKHAEPCPRFHNVMFMRTRGHTCDACAQGDESHRKRHFEIAEQLRAIITACGENSSICPEERQDGVGDPRPPSSDGTSPNGTGSNGTGSNGTGPNDTGPKGTGPNRANGENGTGPNSTGPNRANGENGTSPNGTGPDGANRANGDTPLLSKKERKDLKKLAKAAARPRGVTKRELEYIESILHPSTPNIADGTAPDCVEEVEELECYLRHNADLYHRGDKIVRGRAKFPSVEIDFEVEMNRILDIFKITLLIKTNERNRGLQGRDLSLFNRNVRDFKKAVVEDLVLVKKDEMETRMRRAGYIRVTNQNGLKVIEERYEDRDWKTGLRHRPEDGVVNKAEKPLPEVPAHSENKKAFTSETIYLASTVNKPDLRHLLRQPTKILPPSTNASSQAASPETTNSGLSNSSHFTQTPCHSRVLRVRSDKLSSSSPLNSNCRSVTTPSATSSSAAIPSSPITPPSDDDWIVPKRRRNFEEIAANASYAKVAASSFSSCFAIKNMEANMNEHGTPAYIEQYDGPVEQSPAPVEHPQASVEQPQEPVEQHQASSEKPQVQVLQSAKKQGHDDESKLSDEKVEPEPPAQSMKKVKKRLREAERKEKRRAEKELLASQSQVAAQPLVSSESKVASQSQVDQGTSASTSSHRIDTLLHEDHTSSLPPSSEHAVQQQPVLSEKAKGKQKATASLHDDQPQSPPPTSKHVVHYHPDLSEKTNFEQKASGNIQEVLPTIPEEPQQDICQAAPTQQFHVSGMTVRHYGHDWKRFTKYLAADQPQPFPCIDPDHGKKLFEPTKACLIYPTTPSSYVNSEMVLLPRANRLLSLYQQECTSIGSRIMLADEDMRDCLTIDAAELETLSKMPPLLRGEYDHYVLTGHRGRRMRQVEEYSRLYKKNISGNFPPLSHDTLSRLQARYEDNSIPRGCYCNAPLAEIEAEERKPLHCPYKNCRFGTFHRRCAASAGEVPEPFYCYECPDLMGLEAVNAMRGQESVEDE